MEVLESGYQLVEVILGLVFRHANLGLNPVEKFTTTVAEHHKIKDFRDILKLNAFTTTRLIT